MIVGQVAVGQLGELGRARYRGEAAVDSGAEVENTLGEQIGLLKVEVGLLLEVFVERHIQRAGQIPVRLLVHVVERQEVHRELLERLHALATLLVTLEGVTVFNASRLSARPRLSAFVRCGCPCGENACGEGAWAAFWGCDLASPCCGPGPGVSDPAATVRAVPTRTQMQVGNES